VLGKKFGKIGFFGVGRGGIGVSVVCGFRFCVFFFGGFFFFFFFFLFKVFNRSYYYKGDIIYSNKRKD